MTISLQRTQAGALPRHHYPVPNQSSCRAPETASFNITAASLGAQQIASAFGPAFRHMRILRDLIIPMPDGGAVPTARIDVVLVCEAGVYLFEIKGWRNAFVYRKKSNQGPTRWFLRLDGYSKAREIKDPTWQGVRKTAQLRSRLPEDLRLQCFLLLPCEGVELEGVMPAAVITYQDLPYIARLTRSGGRTGRTHPLLSADAIERTAQLLMDIQGDLTVDDHLRNCRESNARSSVLLTAAHALGLQ